MAAVAAVAAMASGGGHRAALGGEACGLADSGSAVAQGVKHSPSRDPCEVHGVRLMVRRRRKNKDGACLPREHAGQQRAAYTTLIVVRPSNRSGGRQNGAPQRTAAQRGGARVGSKQVLFKSCGCEDASRFWSDQTTRCHELYGSEIMYDI